MSTSWRSRVPRIVGAVQSAVWARAAVIYDGTLDKIFAVTGNGTYAPTSFDWGDTVLALHHDGTGAAGGNPLDSYTPTNFATLNSTDQDLGSTAPAILPPSTVSPKQLAVQGGKDQLLRLVDLGNLSGQSGPGHTGGEIGSTIPVPQGGQVLTQPAVWVNPADSTDWVFVANGNGISGLKLVLSGSTPTLQKVWQDTGGGSSPLIANGVLFYAGSNRITALNPTTGAQLWQSTSIGGIHWESPVVANGVLYITDESQALTAFSLPLDIHPDGDQHGDRDPDEHADRYPHRDGDCDEDRYGDRDCDENADCHPDTEALSSSRVWQGRPDPRDRRLDTPVIESATRPQICRAGLTSPAPPSIRRVGESD